MASERVQRQIDRLLDEAEAAISRSDWAAVRDRTQNVLALDPTNNDAQAFMAAADRALGGPAPQIDSPSTPATSTAQPDQPTSFANGRYEVKRFLGEGGKKKVYLAQDTLLDREVAFALIQTEGLDEVSRTPGSAGHGPPRLPSLHRHRVRSWSRGEPALHGDRTNGRR